MKRPVKPRISPLREQGLIIGLGQRATFVFDKHRSIGAYVDDRDGDLVLVLNSSPDAMVIWPDGAHQIAIIPAQVKK